MIISKSDRSADFKYVRNRFPKPGGCRRNKIQLLGRPDIRISSKAYVVSYGRFANGYVLRDLRISLLRFFTDYPLKWSHSIFLLCQYVLIGNAAPDVMNSDDVLIIFLPIFRHALTGCRGGVRDPAFLVFCI